eukprot:788597-Amphidinium_carterae.1
MNQLNCRLAQDSQVAHLNLVQIQFIELRRFQCFAMSFQCSPCSESAANCSFFEAWHPNDKHATDSIPTSNSKCLDMPNIPCKAGG